jgi:hypothetical protein
MFVLTVLLGLSLHMFVFTRFSIFSLPVAHLADRVFPVA